MKWFSYATSINEKKHGNSLKLDYLLCRESSLTNSKKVIFVKYIKNLRCLPNLYFTVKFSLVRNCQDLVSFQTFAI